MIQVDVGWFAWIKSVKALNSRNEVFEFNSLSTWLVDNEISPDSWIANIFNCFLRRSCKQGFQAVLLAGFKLLWHGDDCVEMVLEEEIQVFLLLRNPPVRDHELMDFPPAGVWSHCLRAAAYHQYANGAQKCLYNLTFPI